MKVAMLTTVHGPYDHRIYHKEAKTLVECGKYDVNVIALGTAVKALDSYRGIDGINIICYPGELKYSKHISNCFKAFLTGLVQKPDIVHVHEPSSLAVGSALKLLYGSKVIYDRHEYYPRLIRERFDARGLKKLANVIEFVETVSEKFMMENVADKVIVVDEEMGNQVKHNQIIHNYPTGYTKKVRSGCNFGYVGMMNLRKIPQSVEIVRKLSEYVPDVRYKIAGMAFDKTDIPENCEHVTYCGVIPHCEVNKFLDDVSWGFCLYEKTDRYETARSTKTFEYIMSGIPVIASRTKGNQFIEDEGYGILIDPDNVEESVEAIREAIPYCTEYSRKCLTAQFGWEEEKLLSLYKSLENEK